MIWGWKRKHVSISYAFVKHTANLRFFPNKHPHNRSHFSPEPCPLSVPPPSTMVPSRLPSRTRLSPALITSSWCFPAGALGFFTTHIVAVEPLACSESRNSWSTLKNLKAEWWAPVKNGCSYIRHMILTYMWHMCMCIYLCVCNPNQSDLPVE